MLVVRLIVFLTLATARDRPNIILLVADDLGVNDVSWNSPGDPTPHLNRLARQGVILDSAYTLPVCSPSRAAILTGVYPFRLGLQRGFGQQVPEGIPTEVLTLPQYLQKLGYVTHMLGKWHLGYCNRRYTPTGRGFNTFHGQYVALEKSVRDNFRERAEKQKSNHRKWRNTKRKLKNTNQGRRRKTRRRNSFRIRNNLRSKKRKFGKKDLQHLERPNSMKSLNYVGKLRQIFGDAQFRPNPVFVYLSFFTKSYSPFQGEADIEDSKQNQIRLMDQTVGSLIEILQNAGMFNNTIIFFISDNGSRPMIKPVPGRFSLKGHKGSIYEGGTRVPAFLHFAKSQGYRYSGLFHSVDIIPTLLGSIPPSSRAGGEIERILEPRTLDGYNHWTEIENFRSSPRQFMVYNIDDELVTRIFNVRDKKTSFQIGVRYKNFKLIWGQPLMLHRSYRKNEAPQPSVLELYDLDRDPGERNNIAGSNVEMVRYLQGFALQEYKSMVPPKTGILALHTQQGLNTSDWCLAVSRHHCSVLSSSRPPEDHARHDLYFGSFRNFQCGLELQY